MDRPETPARLEVVPPARTRADAARTLMTTFGILAIGLLTGILVARALGADGRGELAAIVLWPSVIAYVGDLGLPVAYAHASARDRSCVPALLGNAALVSLAQWLVLSAVGSLIVWTVLSHLGRGVALAGVTFLVIYLPLNLITRYLNALNQGLQRFERFNAVRVAVPLSYALCLTAFLLTGFRSVAWAATAMLLSNLVGLALAIGVSGRSFIRTFGRPRVDLSLLKRNLAYGLRAHIGNLTPVDSLQVDVLLVTALLSARDAGLYSVAVSAAAVIRVQGTALGMVTLPEVAASGDRRRQLSALTSFTRLTLVLGILTATVLLVFSRPLVVLLYGSEFASAAPVVAILAVSMVAGSMRQVIGDGLRGLGLPAAATWAEIASWAVGGLALTAFVPLFGVTGAALGVSAAYVAAFGACAWFTRRAGATWRDLILLRRDDGRNLRLIASTLTRVRRARPEPPAANALAAKANETRP